MGQHCGMNLPRSLPSFIATWMAAVSACLSGGAVAQPVTYVLDPAHSFVHFEVLHFGTSTIRGRIGPVAGSVVLDRTAQRGSVNLRVATASVSTGFAPFDARLRADDLLGSAAFPDAYFVATTVRFAGDAVAEVRGEFTWRGVSQPLSLTALQFNCRQDSTGADTVQVCGGDFEGTLRRSDFGATFGLPFVADSVRLRVQVEGLRRP